MLDPKKLSISKFFTDAFNQTVENNIIILSEKGTIIAINPAFTHNFGYVEDDIIGKDLSFLFTNEDRKKGIPERETRRVNEGGHCFDNNFLVTADGDHLWVSGESVSGNNEKGERIIIKAIQNIHRQKKSENELQRMTGFNDEVLTSINDMVIVLDDHLKLVKANKAFWNVFQLDEKNSADLEFIALINRYDKEDVLLNALKQVNNSGKIFSSLEVEIEVSPDAKKMFQASGNTLRAESGLQNLLLVMHDITLDKQLEREREDIIGFVAHELRNPLSNISLCNELLKMQIEDKNYDQMPAMLHRSQNNLQRLNKMIEELYNATKINSGNLVLDISAFNFDEMIKEIVETTQVQQPDYKILVSGETDFEVTGDRYRIMQVVSNYLSNGIKYSEGSTEIHLQVKKGERFVTVSVEDKGLGIPASQLPYIFKRFFRAEKTRNLEGLGLGLYLCQRIITAHGGKVWVESQEGEGSIFYFSVPLSAESK